MNWIGILSIVMATIVWKISYRHGDCRPATDIRETIPSPRSFRLVYGYFHLAFPVISLSCYATDHPVLFELYHSRVASVIGLGLAALGLSIFVIAKRTLADQYSPCFESRLPSQIVDVGIYSWIRHPIYTGNVVAMAGFALSTGSVWLALNVALLVGYYRWSARREEESLGREFPRYLEYMSRTHRFVPRTSLRDPKHLAKCPVLESRRNHAS
jgi:protein-S-isoprenylcysteine O-methyltransferase Ste14